MAHVEALRYNLNQQKKKKKKKKKEEDNFNAQVIENSWWIKQKTVPVCFIVYFSFNALILDYPDKWNHNFR